MIEYDPFSELDDQEVESTPLKPLHSIDFKNQKDVLEWLSQNFKAGIKASVSRTQQQIKNLALFKGIHYWSQDVKGDFVDDEGVELDTQKIVCNALYELTEARVSKMTRFKPTTVPVPATNEQKDKAGTEVVKAVLETIAYENDKDALLTRTERQATIFGEQDILILWDKQKGPWKGRKAPVGDISFILPLPWQIIKDLSPTAPEAVQWIIYWRYEHVDKVRKDYLEVKKDLIQPSENANYFSVSDLGMRKLADHVLVMEVWGRASTYYDEEFTNGVHFVATNEVLLLLPEANPYPLTSSSRWGNLPIETLTDIDIPGQLHGYSSYQIFGNLNHTINKIYTMANRNLLLMGHPKYMVPSNADVNFEDLGNDATIVTYQGPTPPQLVVAGVIHPEVFKFAELLETKIQTLGGQHPVSTGQPPPGIKAGIAIRLLEDIENQRSTNTIKKHNQLVVDLDRKTLSVVGKFYKNSEERLINIVGRDKGYLRDTFDALILSRPYDIRIQQSSSLPQQPAARVQTIMDLLQIPGIKEMMPNEEWMDMLDLAAPGKFFDAARAAVTVAEWENEEFVSKRIPPEPRMGEHLEVHWRIHSIFYQTRGFMELEEASRHEFELHVLATEYLMWLHAQQNPTFAQQLMTLQNWPMFFSQPQVALPVDQQKPSVAPPQRAPNLPTSEPTAENVLNPTPPPTNQQLIQGGQGAQ